LVIRKSYTGCL
jgi:hypothetical protein